MGLEHVSMLPSVTAKSVASLRIGLTRCSQASNTFKLLETLGNSTVPFWGRKICPATPWGNSWVW